MVIVNQYKFAQHEAPLTKAQTNHAHNGFDDVLEY
jgi:hypothetical protein